MPDREAISWMEGQLWVYTGNLATSAVVAYAQNTRLNLAKGFTNNETMAGTYYDVYTGQRADLSIGAVWCYDGTIARMFDSGTAVHMKLVNSSIAGTAGYMLYSGRIDSFAPDGTEAAPFKYMLAAHFNVWSGING